MGQPLFLIHHPRVMPIARLKLVPGTFVVGRSSNCDFYLPHLTISRRHAEILVVENAVTVRNLGSRNGTFVNDERIDSASIERGESLRFGDVAFLLTDTATAEPIEESDIETAGPGEALPSPTATSEIAQLTVTQRKVLDLILEGMGEKQVAACLAVSHHTVHNHLRRIYRAFKVHSRLELFLRLRPRSGDVPE